MQLFVPAKNKKQAERDAPLWACRFAKVQGGFMAFDSEPVLQKWKDRHPSRRAASTWGDRRGNRAPTARGAQSPCRRQGVTGRLAAAVSMFRRA